MRRAPNHNEPCTGVDGDAISMLHFDTEARQCAGDCGEGMNEEADALEGSGAEVGLSSSPASDSQSTLAFRDIVDGARAYHLWGMLGWQDIRRRYRRSVLGPFWLTISMGVLVAALGTLYAMLFNVEVTRFMPFLALGFIVWTMIHGVISDACVAFVGAEGIIKQTDLPLSVHVYRAMWRSLISFAHNIVIFVVVAVVFDIWPSWAGLLALPGLVLLILNGVWIGLFLGLVSARFRDLPPIVDSVMRIAFFVTPIIWMPEMMGGRAVLLDFNPFFHFVELVRAPLLGQLPGHVSWLVATGITVSGWTLALMMYVRYRRRIAYWV